MCLLYSCLLHVKPVEGIQCNNSLVSHWYGRWVTVELRLLSIFSSFILDREMRVQCSNVLCWPIIIWSHQTRYPLSNGIITHPLCRFRWRMTRIWSNWTNIWTDYFIIREGMPFLTMMIIRVDEMHKSLWFIALVWGNEFLTLLMGSMLWIRIQCIFL